MNGRVLGSSHRTARRVTAYLEKTRWVHWVIPAVIAALFVLVERERVSVQIVARYPDFFAFVERAAQFDPRYPGAFDWAYGLYPLGYPLLLWAGVKLGADVLTTAFALSMAGGVLGLLGAFALIWRLSENYAVAVISEFVLACLGQYLYYGSSESTDMLASGLLIVSLAVLIYADKRWRWVLIAGGLAGASYLVRYTALLTILLCAIYLLTLAVMRRDRAWGIAAGAFVVGAVIGGLPQLIASVIVKGNPFYSIQGHNLWFTLTGSVDYINDWNAMSLDISMLEVFRQYPRQVLDHWWLEFGNFWVTNNVNFLGRPFYSLLQAGLLFTALWRDGLKSQSRFLIGLYAVGHLALLAFMRLDKRFLIMVMPLFVFGAIYLVWQLVPRTVQVRHVSVPVRWPAILILLAWSAMYPWGFRTTNTRDEGTILASNVLHAAGMQSYREVFSTELYLQDVADVWKRRFGAVALTTRGLETHEQLLKLLQDGEYRFFIYDKATGPQLYPKLAELQSPSNRPTGLAPIFAPESGDYAVYRVLGKPGDTFRPLAVSLEGGLRLTGYQVLLSQDQPRGSGQRLGVYLYWTTGQATAERLKVFVHVVNERGELIGQDDSEPQVWFYPTNEWQPGETVLDFHAVPFKEKPSAGKVAIQIGLYSGDTGQRLSVTDAGGATVIENAVVLDVR